MRYFTSPNREMNIVTFESTLSLTFPHLTRFLLASHLAHLVSIWPYARHTWAMLTHQNIKLLTVPMKQAFVWVYCFPTRASLEDCDTHEADTMLISHWIIHLRNPSRQFQKIPCFHNYAISLWYVVNSLPQTCWHWMSKTSVLHKSHTTS